MSLHKPLWAQCFTVFVPALAVLCMHPGLVDPYHHSRFLVLSVLLWLVCLWVYFRKMPAPINHSFLWLMCLSSWCLTSTLWSDFATEGIFAAQKWLLAATSVFVLSSLDQSLGRPRFQTLIARTAQVLSAIVVAGTVVPLTGLLASHSYDHEALYSLKVFTGHKSILAAVLFMLLPLNLMNLRLHGKEYLVVLLCVLQVMTIVALQSRTVFLALLFGMLAGFWMLAKSDLWWQHPLRRRAVALIALLILLGSAFALTPRLSQRLNPTTYLRSDTANERRLVWSRTTDLVMENQYLGIGAGAWKLEFPRVGLQGNYRMEDQDVFFTRAHNDFLEMLVETGPVGLVLLLMVLGSAIYALCTSQTGNHRQKSLLLWGIVGYTIISFLDFPKERVEMLVLLSVYFSFSGTAIGSIKPSLERFIALLLAVSLWGNLMAGFGRVSGELSFKKMIDASAQQRWSQVVHLADCAENRWHRYDPSSVPISYYRGNALVQLGLLAEAEEAYQEAHLLAPHNHHILNNLGTLYLTNRLQQQALAYFEKALDINPRFEDALFNKALVLSQMGEYNEALQTVRRVPLRLELRTVYENEIVRLADSAQASIGQINR